MTWATLFESLKFESLRRNEFIKIYEVIHKNSPATIIDAPKLSLRSIKICALLANFDHFLSTCHFGPDDICRYFFKKLVNITSEKKSLKTYKSSQKMRDKEITL